MRAGLVVLFLNIVLTQRFFDQFDPRASVAGGRGDAVAHATAGCDVT